MLFILTALHAGLVCFFPALVTLSCHGCFVRSELVSTEENAINGDDYSVLENADISDADEVVVDLINCTISDNIDLFKKSHIKIQK